MSCDATVAELLAVDGFAVRRGDGWSVRVPSLQLERGQVVALHGPSGAGKSTALAGMFGLLRGGRGVTIDGSVRWRRGEWGQMLAPSQRHALRHEITFLAQDAQVALDPLAPVGRQICQAAGSTPAAAAAMLAELGVERPDELCRRLPHQVSGGEAQRALLAIAFLRRPLLVVADEPSTSLDAAAYGELRTQLQALQARGVALLLATHDHRLLQDLGASVLVHDGGAFVPGGTPPLPWPEHGREPDIGTVPLLAADGVSVAFAGHAVLRDVQLAVHRGEVVALVGVSGAGKTTLARVLAGLLRPDTGVVRRPPRPRSVQLVPQDAFASLTPRRSLAGLVDETAVGGDVGAMAARLQLDAAALRCEAHQLSGGERRRAALLRAMTVRPDVLVLDEPTAALDRDTAVAVMRSVLELQRDRGIAIVLITHDLELAQAVAHRVVTLRGGRLWAS